MSFVKSLAKTGLFGLAGLAASSGGHKDKKPKPSMISDSATGGPTPSLINNRQLY